MSIVQGISEEQAEFQEYIKQMSMGNQNALEKFYHVYGTLIYGAALACAHSETIADETVNDILIKVWNSAKEIPFIEKPKSWLYTITVNCVKDKLKQQKTHAAIYEVPQNDTNIENIISRDSFFKAISKLKPKDQQIFIYRFIEKMSFPEIAAETKRPLSSVTSDYYRALKKVEVEKLL